MRSAMPIFYHCNVKAALRQNNSIEQYIAIAIMVCVTASGRNHARY